MAISRDTLALLADRRSREARTLLDVGHAGGAYYLAGYAIECGLKACIAKQFRSDVIPDWAMGRIKTHKIDELVKIAGLVLELDAARRDAVFDDQWEMVITWEPERRYDPDVTRELASQMVAAVGDGENGVLRWIRTFL